MAAVLVAELATSHKIGLLTVALIFIFFALACSFIAPRYNPDFPGRGLGVFVATCFVLFALMIGAVEIFGAEGTEETANAAALSKTANRKMNVAVVLTDKQVRLPSKTAHELIQGQYNFRVVNNGQQPHNLVVDGPDVEKVQTNTLQPGESAVLTVKLDTGNYSLYSSVDDDRSNGLVASLSIG